MRRSSRRARGRARSRTSKRHGRPAHGPLWRERVAAALDLEGVVLWAIVLCLRTAGPPRGSRQQHGVRARLRQGVARNEDLRQDQLDRFGVQDSVAMGNRIEQRYKGFLAPHKWKMGISSCMRECAEAQGNNVGLVATTKCYNLYLCSNHGTSPRKDGRIDS